ncbi:MAG: BREX system P-loop protein BrxC [Desulfatibacillaceae bacterium]
MSDTIRDLFASQIDRQIQEVIKVDQTDEELVRNELREYVVTDSIRKHYRQILELFRETPNKPHDGIGVWVSGFFGSGKSSFAKNLGLALANRELAGEKAATLLGQQTGDETVQVLLSNITEHIPTEAVVFDVSTESGIRSGNQPLTEIMYRVFLENLGYARNLDLAELEITLEEEGRLQEFKDTYARETQKDWDREKGKVASAIAHAGRVMHKMEPETYPEADSWYKAAQDQIELNQGILARRCMELMKRRRPNKTLVFVIDEVGQFVARDTRKMLDLGGIVQNFGTHGRGKMWLVVTSQERLTDIVRGIDEQRVELARLQDRFQTRIDLETSDISEVTSKRVLSKNSKAEKVLRDMFSAHRGRIADCTKISADIRLPELNTQSFVDLYPLLPYQIDLIIGVVSGLRTQGGAGRHVGGANRTIIKLTQQLLIRSDVALADKPVGTLARLDQVYDLVSGNIASEVRGKITDIGNKVDHPLAQSVAKAICLFQFVQSVHRTAENIAAALHESVEADSRLPQVREALEALKKARMIREGDDGYRIPTPAEDDWDRIRINLPTPKPGDVNRIHSEVVHGFFKPQPSHSLHDVKTFKAGLFINGRHVAIGDIMVHVALAQTGNDFDDKVAEMRKRSQQEPNAIFWVVPTDDAIYRQTEEVYRSDEMLSRKGRSTTQTESETNLVADEKIRKRRHEEELNRLLRQACLAGSVFFRGNDRSPRAGQDNVKKAAEGVMAEALPEVFNRFDEAAAKVRGQDLESLLTNDNLRGLTPVFSKLKLLKDEGGKAVIDLDSSPLSEVLARIKNRTDYGENASGKYLEQEFAKEPFGWEFDTVRLFAVCLLRAGAVEATSKGQDIDSALSVEAKNTFTSNVQFRQASFRPKVGIDFQELVKANINVQDVFGADIPDLTQNVAAQTIQDLVRGKHDDVQEMHGVLVANGLPGADVLSDANNLMRAIQSGNEERVIQTFNSSCKELKEAITRAGELQHALTEPHLEDLRRAREALHTMWPVLEKEPEVDEALAQRAATLGDLMQKETFFRDLAAIDQHTAAIEKEYRRLLDEAAAARQETYKGALEKLETTQGWENLSEEQRDMVKEPLAKYTARPDPKTANISQLRADSEAAEVRLKKAVERIHRITDGDRLATVRAADYFSGGIEDMEQLETALRGLEEACARHIGSGKKVLVQ